MKPSVLHLFPNEFLPPENVGKYKQTSVVCLSCHLVLVKFKVNQLKLKFLVFNGTCAQKTKGPRLEVLKD